MIWIWNRIFICKYTNRKIKCIDRTGTELNQTLKFQPKKLLNNLTQHFILIKKTTKMLI